MPNEMGRRSLKSIGIHQGVISKDHLFSCYIVYTVSPWFCTVTRSSGSISRKLLQSVHIHTPYRKASKVFPGLLYVYYNTTTTTILLCQVMKIPFQGKKNSFLYSNSRRKYRAHFLCSMYTIHVYDCASVFMLIDIYMHMHAYTNAY